MKESVNFTRFVDRFREMDRKENFTYEGKRALFDYLEEYEESTGEEIELDIIALCCEYNEERPDEIRRNYDIPEEEEVLDYLNDNTLVVGKTTNTIVYQAF